uniref:Peptidase S1 domain-containing protein n=1 Tax=Equus caballus TaxID=9796 RepID=A0A9L0TFQ6_HORSE|nr:serine protease 42-like [Equus caballus]
MGDRSVHKEITSVAVPIPNVVVHPRFSKVVIGQHELALLWLLCPVNLMTTIQPVCIPKETFQVEDGARCWVTRWSRKEEFGGQLYSYIHQKSEQYIINSERLNQLVQQAMSTNKDVVLKGMLCGYKDAGKDACQCPFLKFRVGSIDPVEIHTTEWQHDWSPENVPAWCSGHLPWPRLGCALPVGKEGVKASQLEGQLSCQLEPEVSATSWRTSTKETSSTVKQR